MATTTLIEQCQHMKPATARPAPLRFSGELGQRIPSASAPTQAIGKLDGELTKVLHENQQLITRVTQLESTAETRLERINLLESRVEYHKEFGSAEVAEQYRKAKEEAQRQLDELIARSQDLEAQNGFLERMRQVAESLRDNEKASAERLQALVDELQERIKQDQAIIAALEVASQRAWDLTRALDLIEPRDGRISAEIIYGILERRTHAQDMLLPIAHSSQFADTSAAKLMRQFAQPRTIRIEIIYPGMFKLYVGAVTDDGEPVGEVAVDQTDRCFKDYYYSLFAILELRYPQRAVEDPETEVAGVITIPGVRFGYASPTNPEISYLLVPCSDLEAWGVIHALYEQLTKRHEAM